MAEFIDDRKEYKKIIRDIHIEKMRKNILKGPRNSCKTALKPKRKI